MEKRMTDREFFENVKTLMTTGELTVDPEEMIAKAEIKIASIDRKAVRAKERAAEKRAAGDELTEIVKHYLTEDYAIAADIATAINEAMDADYSDAKIRYRLGELVKSGYAEAIDLIVSRPDSSKKSTLKAYRLAD